jgi:hypothetical protein
MTQAYEKQTVSFANLRRRAQKPAGGFCFIPAELLLAAWWAFRTEQIRLLDLRVWLACFELVARRCRLQKGRLPRYQWREIQQLTGLSDTGHVRRAVARLQELGLLEWGQTRITFPASTRDVRVADADTMHAWIRTVPNRRRKVPVPRRLLLYVARSQRRVLIATALGHILRCMYYRERQCVSGGRCKASWIAAVFEVDERTVKDARRSLILAGWLIPRESPHWAMNRWGLAVVANLSWDAPGRADRARSPHLARRIITGSPPPYGNRKVSSRFNNQKPAPRTVAGASTGTPPGGPPNLRSIVELGLREPERLDRLFSQAVAQGLVRNTACDRLRFFGAAEHAENVGRRNKCGLFVLLIREGRWQFITPNDEDDARRKLKSFDFGEKRDEAHRPHRPRNGSASTDRCNDRRRPHGDDVAGTVAVGYPTWAMMSAALFKSSSA